MKGVRYVTKPVRCLALLSKLNHIIRKYLSKGLPRIKGMSNPYVSLVLLVSFMDADDSNQVWNIATCRKKLPKICLRPDQLVRNYSGNLYKGAYQQKTRISLAPYINTNFKHLKGCLNC